MWIYSGVFCISAREVFNSLIHVVTCLGFCQDKGYTNGGNESRCLGFSRLSS